MVTYEFEEDDENLYDMSIMTNKQYRLLNRKITLLIKISDSNKTAKTTLEQILNVSKNIEGLISKFSTHGEQLSNLSKQLNTFEDKVEKSNASQIKNLKAQVLASKTREDALRMQLNESLTLLENPKRTIHVSNNSELEKLEREYNNKIVQIIAEQLEEFDAKFTPCFNLLLNY